MPSSTPTPTLQEAFELVKAGKLHDALPVLEAIVAQAPDNAEAQHLLGVTLFNLKELSRGIGHMQKALQVNPSRLDYAQVLIRSLKLVNQPGMVRDIIQALPVELRVHPSICIEHAHALLALRQKDDAIAALKRGLEAHPLSAPLYGELGNTYRNAADPVTAEAYYQEALRNSPTDAGTYYNMGNVLLLQHRPKEAQAAFSRALELKPDYPEAQAHLGLAHLMGGDLAAGWPHYEARWKGAGFPSKMLDAPLWDGQNLAGKTLGLSVEQGFGDAFQFATFIGETAKRSGARIVLAAPTPIAALMARIDGVDDVIQPGDTLPQLDAQAPLMSLPGILGVTLDDLPAATAYLSADPDKVDGWKARLGDGPEVKVGIVWRGNPNQLNNLFRSCPAPALAPLCKIDGVKLYALQLDAQDGEMAHLPGVERLGSEFKDFDDTAACMCALDHVLTVCTSTAHLAGGLGVPMTVMLSAGSDWRWFLDRDDSPWYPSATLMRQDKLHDWAGLVDRVAKHLTKLAR